jgi:hypothetical protein
MDCYRDSGVQRPVRYLSPIDHLDGRQEGSEMISWWWTIPAFLLGICFGALLMGLCCANSRDDHNKRWWEE